MKKLLTVLIALSMVAGSFAAEPVANVDMVDFSGEASVKWGIDLETGKSGFVNETDINLTLQFLPDDMSKSTTGSGVWGELVLKVDGATKVEADGVSEGSSPVTVFDAVTVDTAKIHVGNLYVGIQDGDFDFGDDYYYPNALNYANDDENGGAAMFVRSTAQTWGYNQGLVLGYDADMFSVEASVRTKLGSDSFNAAAIDAVAVEAYVEAGKEHTVSSTAANVKYFWGQISATALTVTDGKIKNEDANGQTLYRVTYKLKDATYMTDDYAVGLEVEVKPMENLRIGLGGAYGAYSGGTDISEKEGDFSLFAGADYVMMLSETNSFVPAITYNMYSDKDEYLEDGKTKEGSLTTQSEIGLGLAYRWGASEDSSSLIEDFFGTKTVINDADEGDDDLLPGVSVFTNLNLLGKYSKDDLKFNSATLQKDAGRQYYAGIETNLPILVEFYSGNLEAVPGLKAYGMFHANIASKAAQASWTKGSLKNKDINIEADKKAVSDYLTTTLDEALQVALAVSYDIPVGDMTVTPSLGGLYRYTNAEVAKDTKVKDNSGGAETTLSDTAQKFTLTDFTPVVRVDLAGAVANTTFTAEWNASSYTKLTGKVGDKDQANAYTNDNGEITFKAKIAL